MQDIPMSRWLSPLMAFCLSFVIMATLAPTMGIQIDRQIDFWLLWFGTMLLLALPVCYLEIALAKRSKTTALNALSSLTREADSSPKWRVVGWLAVVFIPFLAGNVLSTASNILVAQFAPSISGQIILQALQLLPWYYLLFPPNTHFINDLRSNRFYCVGKYDGLDFTTLALDQC